MNVVSFNDSRKKADVLADLQRQILPLYGMRSSVFSSVPDLALGPMASCFPGAVFPTGAVHEFLTTAAEDHASTTGFVAGLLSSLLRKGGTSLWISSGRSLYPAALKAFGIEPDRFIFIDVRKQKDLLWAMDEGLKCNAVTTVIGEIPELSFALSRRLQLSVEQSQVTGFMLRCNPRNLQTTACVTRWKIRPIPSIPHEDLPGLGFPSWQVDLLKVRNGKPGSWQLRFINGKFEAIDKQLSSGIEYSIKTA